MQIGICGVKTSECCAGIKPFFLQSGDLFSDRFSQPLPPGWPAKSLP